MMKILNENGWKTLVVSFLLLMVPLFIAFAAPAAAQSGAVTLVDEAGSPLANYPAEYPGETRNLNYRYRCGGSWAPWTPFQTDSSGQLFYNIDCSTVGSGTGTWDSKITMKLNQTSLEQDVTTNSTFQAAKLSVNLKTCNPETTLAGGVVEQGGGYWYTHGTTDGSGLVSFYAFPGNNVKVRMNYNYKSITQDSVPVTLPTTDINFTTTTVNFLYSGLIEIQAGGWPDISSPIELLPGTYGFRFDGILVSGVEVSGCEMDVSPGTNESPVVDAGGPYSGDEEMPIPLSGSVSDPDNDPLTLLWTVDNPGVCAFSDSSILNPQLTCDVEGSYTVTLTADDGTADPVDDTAQITVSAVPIGAKVKIHPRRLWFMFDDDDEPELEGVWPWVMSVFVFSNDTIDATTLDPATVAIGDPNLSGTTTPYWYWDRDFNRDGKRDRVFFVRTRGLWRGGAVAASTTKLKLTGQTTAGDDVTGSSSIRVRFVYDD